jgi:hypothetical protein
VPIEEEEVTQVAAPQMKPLNVKNEYLGLSTASTEKLGEC